MAQFKSSRLDESMRRGLALHQAGRLAEAEAIYRDVLKRQPRHAAANHLLGLVRLQRGDADGAARSIARAIAARGDDPQYHGNLGVALDAAGRPTEAVASFDRAIALSPGFAEAWSNRGKALRQLGRLEEAVASYREALARKPGEAGFQLNLANALADLGDLPTAETAYREALALRPCYPAALSGLCRMLEALGRADAAVAAGEQAAARYPREPEHHRALGRALLAAGRPAEAVESYRRALALDATDAEAWRLMSLIQRRAAHDADMQAMERLLARPDLPDAQRAHLHFALGKGLDELGDVAASFGHYRAGNDLLHRAAPFPLAAAEREVETLLRLFADPAPLPRAAPVEAPPVFIVGLPRAGKSSLEGMLARHPALRRGGELPLLGHAVAHLRREAGLAEPGALAALAAEYLAGARRLAPPPLRLLDTMPLNLMHVGFIRLALPDAVILHCVRDPLEHAVAIYQKYFGRPGYEFSTDLGDLAAWYRLYRRLMAHWHAVFPGAILDVDVAALRRAPEEPMRRILDFCGLDWDPACLVPFDPEPEIGEAPPPADRLAPYRDLLSRDPQSGILSREAGGAVGNPLPRSGGGGPPEGWWRGRG